jgi:hypothetical protein
MIVTGPTRDGTRLGLIDVGVPRYISTKEARPHTGLLFYWRWGKRGLKTGATKPSAGVSPRDRNGLGECATGIVTRFHLSKPPVRN